MTTDTLLRMTQVQSAIGLSRSTIYDLLRDGDFPKPVRCGRIVRFSANEINAWIQAQKNKRA